MILPEVQVSELANLQQDYYSVDSPELCPNLAHLRDYPHAISYRFNSRGFRDAEWPNDLTSAIWCIGDSATVGVGNPVEHTWTYLLAQRTGRRTINVSMTGASNTWIARKAQTIIEQVQPDYAVIQWSFFSRRESTDTTKSELDRQLQHGERLDLDEDVEDFMRCYLMIESVKGRTQIQHSIVPDAFPGISEKEIRGWYHTHSQAYWPEQMPASWELFDSRVKKDLARKDLTQSFRWHFAMQDFFRKNNIVLLDQLHENYQRERARDSLHYSIKTAGQFVDQIWSRLI